MRYSQYNFLRIWTICLLLTGGTMGARAIAFVSQDPAVAPDSALEGERDSMLFRLNLAYLNGVKDHRTPFELIPIIEQILSLDPALYNHWLNLGMEQIKIRKYEKAARSFERGLEMHPDPSHPSLVQVHLSLSFCYHKTGRHRREQMILDEMNTIHPDHPGVMGRYMICAYSRMRYRESDHYRDRLIRILRKDGFNESDLAFYLGRLYENTDYVEAEKYYRKAYRYDRDNVDKMAALAWILIKKALTLREGMKLIDQAIEEEPRNPKLLHQQGYGYFLRGDFEDALGNLRSAMELYEEYNYDLYDHIRMVEEAIARRE